MDRFREMKIHPDRITQSGLEGLLNTTEGELMEIRGFGPRDARDIPRGYRLVFDPQRPRPFYDVVAVTPENDPFGSLEQSIRMAHEALDTFVGSVESTFAGLHERYLVFKRAKPGSQ